MPSFLLEFLKLTFELIGLFFLISFLVGIGQFFINPKSKIFKFSRSNKFLSACCGALLGGVTPFCSCSTIPLFVGFVNSKAPFSTSIAFLLASPIMNPAIITLMGVFSGLKLQFCTVYVLLSLQFCADWFWRNLGLKRDL